MTTTTRAATGMDHPFCWALHRATMRAYVEATWGCWDDRDQLERFGAAFDVAAWQILEVEGVRVGALRVDASGSPVRLLNVLIAPAFQRKGHGTALIRRIIEDAAERPVWLQVLKVNPAISLYRRLGFKVIEDTDTHWQMLREPSVSNPR